MGEPHRYENFNGLMEYLKWLNGGSATLRDYPITSRIVTDSVHYAVHGGDFCTYNLVGTIGAGTVNAKFAIIKPFVDLTFHFQGVVSAKNSGWFELYEGCDFAGGLQDVARNNNRTILVTPQLYVVTGGTIISCGTLLQSRAVGSYSPVVKIGGECDTRNEWILSDLHWYLVWFYADNADTEISLDIEGYLVDDSWV